MIQRDYILRMIEQFAAIAHRILGFRTSQQHNQALEVIRSAYKAFLSCDKEFIESQSVEDLISLMENGVLRPEQLTMIAKLLAEEATILEACEAGDEARRCRLKSLAVYLAVFLGPGAPSMDSYFAEVEKVAELLRPVGIPLQLGARLPFYFERRGCYAAAEDALFRAAEVAPPSHPVFQEGLAFFDRLAHRSEEELEKGGLALSEVGEGHLEFKGLHLRRRKEFGDGA